MKRFIESSDRGQSTLLPELQQRRYDCVNFTINKVEKNDADSDLAIDSDGRLWQGSIAELGTLNVCGSQKNFGIVVTPDGKGGKWLAIGK